MTPLLRRASRRHLYRHRGQSVLAVLGVALAVALVTGIDVANHSANHAFRSSVEQVAGRTTHQIEGGPGGLREEVYRQLRLVTRLRACAPVVEGPVKVPLRDEDRGAVSPGAVSPGTVSSEVTLPLRLLGIDPFAEQPIRTITSTSTLGDVADFLTRPGAIVLGQPLADRLGVTMGDGFHIRAAGTTGVPAVHDLVVVGVLRPRNANETELLHGLLIGDLATAQEILDMPGYLTRIDVVLSSDGNLDNLDNLDAAALRKVLPPEVALIPRAQRAGSLAQMTRAFRLNLNALSLLALVVGAFLIYNASAFSVVQRRSLLGILRAVGVTRREIVMLVLHEALIIGVLGTVIGLLLGRVLAESLLVLVTRTINDLYAPVTDAHVAIAPWTLVKSVALGLGASLVAAWFPAQEAANVPPRAATLRSDREGRASRHAPRLAMLGMGLLGVAAALLAVPSRSLLIAFGAVLALVLGYAALVPATTGTILTLTAPGLRRVFGVLGGMAARDAARSLSRTGVATAALVVAVAVTIGVSIMIGSFRATLIDWLDVTLQADVYVVSASGADGNRRTTLSPDIVTRLSTAPMVDHATTYQRVEVSSPTGPVAILALGGGTRSFGIFRLADGDHKAAIRRLQSEDAVLISEPFSFHHQLEIGDQVRLRTARGEHNFPVAGVFFDYGSDRGVVLMARAAYDRWWQDDAIHSLGLYGKANVDLPAQLATLVTPRDGVRLIPNRALRETSLTIFDRTFAITSVLRLLAIAVAFVGVLSALLALQLERARELAVLRVNGLTPRQLGVLVTGQTGLLGLAAGVLAAPLGIAMAVVLVQVINRRSFGWTLVLELPPSILLQSVAMAVCASVIAGLLPLRQLTIPEPATALRHE